MLTKPSQYKNKNKGHRAQSAMEYLMTYGWAILIIAVVLGALFSLGVFNGGAGLSSACVASSGYLCTTPSYSHSTGVISVSLGQNTGTSWYASNFIFVPQGTAIVGGLPQTLSSWQLIQINGNLIYGGTSAGLISGQTAPTLELPVNGVSVNTLALAPGISTLTVGTPVTGAIWVEYTTTTSPTSPQYAQIATINLKAS